MVSRLGYEHMGLEYPFGDNDSDRDKAEIEDDDETSENNGSIQIKFNNI